MTQRRIPMGIGGLPILEWMVEAFGYPFDLCSSVKPPDGVIEALADIWYQRDNFRDGEIVHPDVTRDDYLRDIQDEVGHMAGERRIPTGDPVLPGDAA